MGQLIRGANGACDTVQIIDWSHTLNSGDGALARSLGNVRSFQVKSTLSGAESCGS